MWLKLDTISCLQSCFFSRMLMYLHLLFSATGGQQKEIVSTTVTYRQYGEANSCLFAHSADKQQYYCHLIGGFGLWKTSEVNTGLFSY